MRALAAMATLASLIALAGCYGGGGPSATTGPAVQGKAGTTTASKGSMLNPNFHGNPDAQVGAKLR